MQKLIKIRNLLLIALTLLSSPFIYAQDYFSTQLCLSGQFDCIKINKSDSWTSLWPDPDERDLVQRLNRMNTRLRTRMLIAIPKKGQLTRMDLSPFPAHITPPHSKILAVDLTLLAWCAYDSDGNLLRWGPASGGRSWCKDIEASGKTIIGRFEIYDVRGKNCRSTKFPINEGGAPMPYAMFFKGNYALHGSTEVPGYNASHGCIRVFFDDAKWINEVFVKSPGPTYVLILPY